MRVCLALLLGLLLPALALAQAPTLTSVLPSASNNTGGPVALTVIGTNLGTATQATFTGPATVNVTGTDIAVVDATNIVVVAPVQVMPAGNYQLRVTAAGGPSTNTLAFQVTNAAPEVDSVAPSAGGNIAAQSVAIAGRNFAGATRVDFIGPVTRNLAFTINSATQITATVPAALPAGTYRLQVQASTGPSNDDVTFRVDEARTTATAQVVDQFGNPKSNVALGGDRLFVQVTDADKNTDSSSQQSVTVTVTDSGTGDSEVITLTETSASSGVFRNTTGLNTARAGGTPNNATFESQPGNTITATYIDAIFGDRAVGVAVSTAAASTSVTQFVNSVGAVQFTYNIGTDAIFCQVSDSDRNLNVGLAETVRVTVTDPNTGDRELLTLTETGLSTGVFRNTGGLTNVRAFTPTIGNNVLETQDFSTIRVDYTDPGNSADATFAVATMRDRVPSQTRFTDAFGTARTSYVIGTDQVFVTVTDQNVNTNPNLAERINVTVTVATTGDSETVELVETGISTGVFRNTTGVSTRVATASSNGTLDATANTSITATYTDPRDPTDTSNNTATLRAQPTGASVSFSNQIGTVVSEYRIGTELIFITLTDADENELPNAADTVTVNLVDGRTGDAQAVTLVETGVNTGVFRNSVGLTSQVGTVVANDGIIQTSNGSTLSANYRDNDDTNDAAAGFVIMRLAPTASSTFFSDTGGNPKSQFTITANDVFLTVQDFDRNTDSASRQTVVATLRDTATGDTESITLLETGIDTGIFRNTVGFTSTRNTTGSAIAGNNNLEVGDGDTLTGSYTDPNNPGDISNSAALMRFITASTTFFSDSLGLRRDEFVIGVNDLFVTVIDRDQGSLTSPPPTVRTVVVSLSDPVTFDVKQLTLTEDPNVLGTFRNSTGFPMVKGAADTSDPNRLHVAANSRIAASYADPDDNSDASQGLATARSPGTTASTFFSDQVGNPVATLDIGQGFFVTVQDENRNLNAGLTDSVTVTIIDGASGDVENLVLRETGANTGVFRNPTAFPMRVAVAVANGQLESADGSTVTANYVDPDQGEFQAAFATARKGVNPDNPRLARFTDATGQTVTQYAIGDPAQLVFVTVQEPDANLNASLSDQVTVVVRDTNPAQPDSVTLVLNEIDPTTGQLANNTGFFRNQTGVLTRLSSPPIINNTLEVLAGDFLNIQYTPRGGLPPTQAPVNAQVVIRQGNSTLVFTDAAGAQRTVFTIGAEQVFVTLTDTDENRNPVAIETKTVSLVSTITGDVEANITLTETGPNTGVFRNAAGVVTVLSSATSGNGRVETAGGAILTANYTDPDDTADRSLATATMAAEEVPATRLEFRTGIGGTSSIATFYEAFTAGRNQAFLLLADSDENTDPTTVQSVRVSLVSSGIPIDDTQSVTLTETGANTGVFESTAGVPITVGVPARENGTIEAFDGGGLIATYADDESPGDRLTTRLLVSVGKIPVSTVFFSDTTGVSKTSYEAETDLVFFTVVDASANRNAGLVESVNVTLTSPATGDQLGVQLVETTASSGVFRNPSGVRTAVAPAASDGVLQVATEADITGIYVDPRDANDTATGRARMKAKLANSITRLTDAVGSSRSTYVIGVDQIFVTVTDPDQNKNPTVLDSVRVTLTSTVTNDAVIVTLLETSAASGVFRNTAGIPTANVSVDSTNQRLETAAGATVRASYQDPVNPTDSSFAEARMNLPGTTSQTFFLRSVGSTTTTAEFALVSDPLFIRVVDPDKLKDPTVVETVRVTLRNEATGDQEVVTLTEVAGTASSAAGLRFENLTGIPTRVDLAVAGNGILEGSVDTTVTATYLDPDDNTDRSTAQALLKGQISTPVVRFTDRAGTDVAEYNIGSTDGVFVTVTDPAANKTASASVRDTVVTSIFDTTTGDIAALTLFEQPDSNGLFNSGIFRNLTNLPSTVGQPPTEITTTLFTANNSTIIASYLRAGQSQGGTVTTSVPFDPVVAKILTTQRGPNGQSCFTCHSDDNRQGGLNLTGFRDTQRGGLSGSAIVPGNSQQSLLVRKLETSATNPFAEGHPALAPDPALKVGGVISEADLARLKAWIDQGAVSPTLPTSVAFDTLQAQVLTPSCANNPGAAGACHDPVNQSGGIRLNDLSGFLDAIRFRNAAVLGNGPGSRMVQVLTDPTLNHSGVRLDFPAGDARNISRAAAQLLSTYISQQYPGAPGIPRREYNGDVQPYFDRNCTTSGCHNGQDKAGGLSLTSFGALQAGGVSGMEVNPGDVPRSRLTSKIDRIADPVHTAVIPATFFSSQGPTVITSWVNQGAFPGSGGVLTLPPTGAVTDSAVMKIGPTTGTVQFTDGNGTPVDFYQIGAEGIFVTVVDVNRNTTPNQMETVVVSITDGRTGDSEQVTLTETTPGSSTFRNQTALTSIVGGRTADGVIQTVNGSTLTATYVDTVFPETVTDTVQMTTNSRGRLRFVDRSGLPVGSYFIGQDSVIIEVNDPDQSGRLRLDAATVTLNVSPTGDFERNSLVMSEVTTQPGVFRSQPLATTDRVTSTRENGQVETVHLGELNATYVDATFPSDNVSATAITRAAPFQSQMSFTDQAGTTKTAFALGTEDLFVTLRDANRNISSVTTDVVQISLFNDQNGDVENVQLFELSVNSGIFRNRTGVRTVLQATAAPGNGTVEITDTGAPQIAVRAEYVDVVAPPDIRNVFANVVIEGGSVVNFTDNQGVIKTRYTRGVDLIFVIVADSNRNVNRNLAETITVTVTDPSVTPIDEETLILTETGVNTGVFRNRTGLTTVFGFPTSTPGNGVLETRVNSIANPGEVIEVTYVDPTRTSDVSTARAELVPKDPNDSDDDKMPDTFEDANGLNKLDPTDAALDFDGDGFTNLEEFLNGTDPRNPFDNKPIADAGPSRSVDPGVVQLDGSASRDPRARALTYRWTQANAGTAGHDDAVTLSNATAVKPTFVGRGGRTRAGRDKSLYDFDLVVSNFRVSSNPSRVTITVNNVPPSTFAGIDQALTLGETITLNGKETADANGETAELAYAWSRPVGAGGFNSAIAAPSVLPSLVGTYDFALTATDPASNAAVDRVFVVVHQGTNHVPLASVPKRITAVVGQTVSVDGSGSADADPDDTLTYNWTVTKVPAGTGVVTPLPARSQISKTNLVLPRPGYYEVTLTVTDAVGNTSPPAVVGIVADFNGSGATVPDRTPIAAVGGSLTGNVNGTVTLDGRASRDPDGATLTYAWEQFRGVKVALNNPTTATPNFIPLDPGVYGFRLTVNDGTTTSAPEEVFVTVNSQTQRVPVAAAGTNQVVTLQSSGVTVSLDGSASRDADNERLVYYWHQVSGPGIALASRETSRPTFFTRQFGTYVFDLTVYDGRNFSLPSRVTVQVNPFGIGVPVANAGANQTAFFVGSPVSVTLNGSASSDPGGLLPLTYQWTQVGGPAVTLTPGADVPNPQFLAPAIGAYRFQLVVKNSRNVPSLPVFTLVTVVDGSIEPPLIRVNGSSGASATVKVQGGTPVVLDASQSQARIGGQLSFVWQQDSGPPLLITDASSSKATVTPVNSGTYVFSVAVLDTRSNQGTGSVVVLVGTDAPSGTGTSAGPVGGDPGVVLETGGGGGGGGCEMQRGKSEGLNFGAVALLWLALVALRLTRRR